MSAVVSDPERTVEGMTTTSERPIHDGGNFRLDNDERTKRPPVLAVPPGTRPEIVCPDWCTVSYDEHFGDLGEWEGIVIHRSDGAIGVYHSRCAYPDNALHDEAPSVSIESSQDLELDEAEALAVRILECVAQARGAQVPR